jgi:hypothetical protein
MLITRDVDHKGVEGPLMVVRTILLVLIEPATTCTVVGLMGYYSTVAVRFSVRCLECVSGLITGWVGGP